MGGDRLGRSSIRHTLVLMHAGPSRADSGGDRQTVSIKMRATREGLSICGRRLLADQQLVDELASVRRGAAVDHLADLGRSPDRAAPRRVRRT